MCKSEVSSPITWSHVVSAHLQLSGGWYSTGFWGVIRREWVARMMELGYNTQDELLQRFKAWRPRLVPDLWRITNEEMWILEIEDSHPLTPSLLVEYDRLMSDGPGQYRLFSSDRHERFLEIDVERITNLIYLLEEEASHPVRGWSSGGLLSVSSSLGERVLRSKEQNARPSS